MQRNSSVAEANHNGSVTGQPPQQPVLYPVRLVYDAVILNPGPEMQNQTLFMNPQPIMQWTPYVNHTQPQISLNQQPHIAPVMPMPVQGPRASIPPWLKKHQVPVNQNPNHFSQSIRAPYAGQTQAPSYVLQNNMPVAYATVNNLHEHLPNPSVAAVLNQRQNVPMLNYRVQSPHNVQANRNLAGVAYNQAGMARFTQVPNARQFAAPQTMAKTNIHPNLQIRKNQEMNRVSQSTMTNVSYCENRKILKTNTITGHSRMPLLSNPSQTNVNNKTLRPANPNVSYSQTALTQRSNFIAVNPTIRQNMVKLESPNTTKIAIPAGPFVNNKVIGIVNPKSIIKENSTNHASNQKITSPSALNSKEICYDEITSRIENSVIKTEVKSFSENEHSLINDKKRKNSSQTEAQKKIKELEETAPNKLTEEADLLPVKEKGDKNDDNVVNKNLNVDEEKEGCKANEIIIQKQTSGKCSIVDQNDAKAEIPATVPNRILNHVIDGIVIQESKYPFKQELEANVNVENGKSIKSSSLNGNEENKVVVNCNTEKRDIDLQLPKYNILSHVIDGIVIQESDVPFAIRTPLREKSRSTNTQAIVPKKNIREVKSRNKKIKDVNERKDNTQNKSRLQSEKDNTKEKDISVDETPKHDNIKNDGDETVTSILRNRLENGNDGESKIMIEKVEIVIEDKKTVVSDRVKESNSKEDGNEDVPNIDSLESVDAERLESWTCDELQSRLRTAWCPCFAALQHEEVDGRALLLAEERQLLDIGLHSEHARALCNLARRSSEHNLAGKLVETTRSPQK